ncbi:MAG: DMT family transporter, partial [Anaerotignum sp.]|nr:DMT family transporter [Anaerotignum sp.]
MRIKNKVLMGSVACIIAACLWGISGATGQYLFKFTGVTPEWVVSTRTLFVGIIMLTYLQLTRGGIFEIWTNKEDRKDILIFSLVGMLFTQYGYFAAIKHCNAATATVLQYTAPIMIVVYLAVKN